MQESLQETGAPPRDTGAASPPSLSRRAGVLLRDVRDLACDHLELAALEAQRAAMGLTKMLTAAVVVSILLVSAWLALVAGGIVWATTAGIGWAAALAIAAVLNLVLAAAVAYWMRHQTQELLFAASLRQLRRSADDVQEAA